jgi:hypothetical protein
MRKEGVVVHIWTTDIGYLFSFFLLVYLVTHCEYSVYFLHTRLVFVHLS